MENKLRAIVATKQLEVDTLKRRLRETEDKLAHEYNTRLRADKTRKKTVRVTESSDSDK
jgi:hypothetical protein